MVTIYIHNLQIIHKRNNRYARTDSLLQPKLGMGQCICFPALFTERKDVFAFHCLYMLNTDPVFM